MELSSNITILSADYKHMKSPIRLLLCVLSFTLAAAVLSAGDLWYRALDIDAYENMVGRYQLTPAEANEVNAYRFTYNEDGRLTRIVYQNSGRALPVPRYGVQRIEFVYEEGYIHRWFTDDTGKPVANEDGVWGHRVPQDSYGHALGVIHYDAYGNIIPNKYGIAQRLWLVDKAGRKYLERYFDSAGARIMDNRGVGELHYTWNSANQLISMAFFDVNGKRTSSSDAGVHLYHWQWNENGDSIREERYDTRGKLTLATDGSAIVEWERNKKGLITLERRLGLDDLARKDAKGVAFYRFYHDAAGNLVAQIHYDAYGKPIQDIAGVVTYRWVHFKQSRDLEQLNLDADGNLVEDDRGMASYRWTYDNRGLVVSSISFGTDNSPKKDQWGIARYQYVYNDARQLIEASSFQDLETLAMDNSGVAIYRWDYDSLGNRSAERHYGTENTKVEDKRGIAEYRWVYDNESRRIEQRQFGLYNQLRADPEGVAIYTWNYDGYGRALEQQHYGVDERPVDNAAGTALTRWSYDKQGRLLTFANFDRRTMPDW
ncbi:MAG: hypothetical protein B0D92_00750 [Spirochaeta sp. LUC14_002_19_P3]|nr:MAG: hypothetical protein B0D92_00750 [Spirochaeta sp. LUC14_002_19_P3]